MGSTLEHGIYLPSEGEKNCYQGLAGNWNKVDGALGDVAELKQLIESKFTKEIVTELPTEDINPYCIYMILKTDPETNNIYDEWVYINNAWEYLGNTKVDMTQYYTKQEVNQLPAVASGVTATKVGNYDAHIANGDVHVTASDKTKWTNSANTHVLRLALSALTPSTSDNSFSNLDDSTALKVGDKVMDTAGVLFEVTAIDTANSTFTIGTALVDLAQDSDVVHKSGNETVNGEKTFNDLQTISYGTQYKGARNAYILPEFSAGYSGLSITTLSFSQTLKIGSFVLDSNNKATLDTSKAYIQIATGESNSVNTCVLEPRNSTTSLLGTSSNKWKQINGLTPSSLSLPTDNIANIIDISGYLTVLDGSQANTYQAPANGWISITMSYCSGIQAYINGLWGHQVVRPSTGSVRFLMPILKDKTVNILIFGGTIDNARFIPCQGNV